MRRRCRRHCRTDDIRSALDGEVLVDIVLHVLPEWIIVVDVCINRLENALYRTDREGVGFAGIEVGRIACKDEVCKIVKSLFPCALYPLEVAAVFLGERPVTGVYNFIVPVVVEGIPPREPLDGGVGGGSLRNVGEHDSGGCHYSLGVFG